MTQAVDAVLGLSAFEAEQAISMSFTSKGLSVPNLWQQNYKAIEQTPGLKIYVGPSASPISAGSPSSNRF
ncbi:MAG TPA: hypothetical protein VLC51_02155 [Nitrospira sp.]|nr:hypothetical protein [Nitrospira sp.]